MSLTLQHLNLSHNKFEVVGTQALASWLFKSKDSSSLKTLLIGRSAVIFQVLAPGLQCVHGLQVLDISDVVVDSKGKEFFFSVPNNVIIG